MIRSVDTLQCYASYTVAKLKDGKCWMYSNLKIAGKTITSEDSNITGSYTVPSSNLSSFNNYSSDNQAVYLDSSYGGYYTWQVATAGTGSSYTSDGQNTPSSICPKGWRLPTGDSSGEFVTVNNAYGGSVSSCANMSATPFPGFIRSGYIYGAYINAQNEHFDYWSSTAQDSGNAYTMACTSSWLKASRPYSRHAGFAIRCIAT